MLRDSRAGLLAGLAATALILAPSALGQAPASLEVAGQGEVTRLRIVLPEESGGDLSVQADIAAGAVLVARLSEPITADLSTLVQAAPERIAMARLDPDGRTLRLALNTELEPRVSVSHNVIAIDLAPPGAAPLPDVVSAYERARAAEAAAREAARLAAEAAASAPPPPLPVSVRVGEAADYTRIAFQWPEAVTYALERQDGRAVLRFSRRADIDLSALAGGPPRFVDAVTQVDGEGLSVAFALAGEAEARVWSDEPGRVVLDVAPPGGVGAQGALDALAAYAAGRQDTAEAAPPDGEAPSSGPAAADAGSDGAAPRERQARRDPVPDGGVVPVQVRQVDQDLVLSFSWESLPGAAVFRRGEAVWIVFDAAVDFEDGEIPAAASRHITGHRAVRGPDYAALRLESPAATQADVRAAGAAWIVTLADAVDAPPRPVRIARETGFNSPALLRFGLGGARSTRVVEDPVIGDALHVLTADGEKRGVITPRRFAEVAVLASSHGVAVQTFAEDIRFEAEPGGAVLTRPGGLTLSRAADPTLTGGGDQPVTAGFLDLQRWRGAAPYLETKARLERAALELEPEPLLALARFHLAWSLAPEALAVTELAVDERPTLETTAEVAALRGAAQYMAGRIEAAEASLSHPELLDDPAAQPWRGLTAAKQGRWAEARRRFEDGRESAFFFDPLWRSRIRAWHALSALETNDIGGVRGLADQVAAQSDDPEALAVAGMARAGLAAVQGDVNRAIARYDALTRHEWTPIQARAMLARLKLQLEHDRIEPDAAVDALESLRFRWRGDSVEIEAAAMLGRVYAQAGRYSAALSTMDAARTRFSGSATARRLSLEMETLFRDLFLHGQADRMDPLDALALWYEHYETIAIMGPDGLRMARRIAERLIEIDLLEPAGELLAHQVFERNITMTNLARAQIAADLARVRLMDDRPEAALQALEATRVARLPEDLVRDRRLLQARALSDLGRTEHALELVANDAGPDVERLRAEIAWEADDWSDAGRRAEGLLGARWRDRTALSAREAHDVLRAAIAYALAGEEAGLERIESRYGRAMADTAHAVAFSQVVGGASATGGARLSGLVAEIGAFEDTDALMAGFRAEPAGVGDPAES